MPIKLCAPVTQFISRSCLLLLKGKVAPVTGGVKNFGGLISRQMAGAEASDTAHYNSGSKKGARDTVKEIKRAGREGSCVPS